MSRWLSSVPRRRPPHHHENPGLKLVLGFAALILVGTGLLVLPWAAADGDSVGFVDALFTATSATCVTGLIVLDTLKDFSGFGHAVILILIQLGGLGIIVAASTLMLLLGRRIYLKDRLVLQEAMGRASSAGVVRLTREIVSVTLLIEAAGALVLFFRFANLYPAPRAIWLSVFHAVSAFNNAGFDLFSTNLRGWAADPLVVMPIAVLIILGGIGFPVIHEGLQPVYRWMLRRRTPGVAADAPDVQPRVQRRHRLSLHARTVLIMTGMLLGGGTALYLLLEWNNPETFGALSAPVRVMAAFFSAVTARTAGFEVVFTGGFYPATLLITCVLMFIGASPGGTGGGIKTTTFTVLIATLRATARGQESVQMMDRRLPPDLTHRAWAVVAAAAASVLIITTLLLITDSGHEPLKLFFETVSAFGTVGLGTGVTPLLSNPGKLLLVCMMYLGRVGPLTLAVALAVRHRPGAVEFPEERVMIG